MQRLFAFDIDDTLYDCAEPLLRAWNSAFNGRFELPSDELFVRFRSHSDEAYEKVLLNEKSTAYMHVYRVVQTLLDYGYCVSEQEALSFQKLYEQEQKAIRISPEMTLLLDALYKDGHLLGCITNGDSLHQRAKARQLELSRWISNERILISGEFGYAKPDPSLFRELAGFAEASHEVELWYVGDTFETDIEGACAAGWKSIWINRRCRTRPGSLALATIEVHTEAELCECIHSLVQ